MPVTRGIVFREALAIPLLTIFRQVMDVQLVYQRRRRKCKALLQEVSFCTGELITACRQAVTD